MSVATGLIATALVAVLPVQAALTWGGTKNLFVFGDSYS